LEDMLGTCIVIFESLIWLYHCNFYIHDNGPGISEELLSKINRGEYEPKGTGIGLKNIDERIKMTFGKEYGIKIESQLGKGTTVIISIPRRRCGSDV